MLEQIEDAKDAVGDIYAIALRFAVDQLQEDDGITYDSEGCDVVEMLADLPDLWDVNFSDWDNDSLTSRFGKEEHQVKYRNFVKTEPSKPVVGEGALPHRKRWCH